MLPCVNCQYAPVSMRVCATGLCDRAHARNSKIEHKKQRYTHKTNTQTEIKRERLTKRLHTHTHEPAKAAVYAAESAVYIRIYYTIYIHNIYIHTTRQRQRCMRRKVPGALSTSHAPRTQRRTFVSFEHVSRYFAYASLSKPHTCIYTCIHTHLEACVCVRERECVCMCMCIHTHLEACVHALAYVHSFVCIK